MAATIESEPAAALFILSFRQRDELAQQAADAGWRVVAARRREGADRRFLASGAQVVVIDARGALGDGLSAARMLGGQVAAAGGAMLALVSHGDIGRIGDFYDAGATHFLASPSMQAEFAQALRFAARHAERMAGEWRPAPSRAPLGWRCAAGEPLRLTPSLADLLGLPAETGVRRLLATIPADERAGTVAAVRRALASGATAFAHDWPPLGRVVQHLQRDGAGIATLLEPLGPPAEAADRIRDAWTGAADATAARRWIAERIADDAPMGVLAVALTRFDIVNAAFGRAAGDQLLRLVGRRLAEIGRDLPDGAMVARTGGSEFLIAAVAPAERLTLAARRVSRELARPFAAADTAVTLGSRVALVTREAQDDAGSLLHRAAEALASARSGASVPIKPGKAGVAPIDTLAVDLHRAIERDELEVLFQPQVAFADGRIVGAEALARWEHPRLGVLGAETLFAAADRADLALALSDKVQALALTRAAAWPASLAALRVSVNVTAADLAQPDFATRLLERIAGSGFPPARLTIEVTETGLIESLDTAADLLAILREAGCRVAIDDFGTGYSSLAYLAALPIDYLKIDRALSQDIAGSWRDRVVVRGVIEMARSLSLATIAEGVETEEQRALLAAEGCDLYQGFLCAEPLGTTALARLVEGR